MRVAPDPQKILITDPHLKGGGQVRYVANLARELVRNGHEVVLGCKRESVLVDHAREAGAIARNAFCFRGGLRPNLWRRDIAEMRRFIREEKPDLIHVNGSQDHWISAVANRSMGRPVCLVRTRHNTYPVHNLWPNRVLNRDWTDFHVVVCEDVRARLAEQPAFEGVAMCTVHNGVDAEMFHPDPEMRRKARTEFGYSDEDVVCGVAARLVPDKGHEFLLRAAALLARRVPQLRILILGEGALEGKLKGLVRELGIASKVRFCGFRKDMAYCVQAFDIGVQPSVGCDTSSFSLKEQMAAEKPVVASDYGGLKEIVTDGIEGFVVPAGTVEPLAAALRRLIENTDLRGPMGKAGRKRVLREFTVQVFAARTVEAYCRALAVHRARRDRR